MGGFSISGLGGGLDVRGIVNQLMMVEAAPIRRMETQKDNFQKKIDAYNTLNSRLSTLLSKIESLNSADKFAARKTSSSDEKILTATADSTASAGTYQITVSRLARFDNFASDATFATSDDTIGTGSFDITIDGTTTPITIDGTNNTLAGLKSAINKSGADVNASIVNDGSGYRLTITSKNSGSTNAITISNNTLTLSDGSTPFTFTRTHSIASTSELDASLTVNGLSVTAGTNQVEGVIEGVTLNLVGTSASSISLTVSNDTEKVKTAVQDFVTAYNDAYKFLNSQFTFNSALDRAGTLAGDSVVRQIQSDLSQIVSRSISGLSGTITSLGAAGVNLKNDGTLEIDSTKLDEKLTDNFEEIKKLFLALGEAVDSRIKYLSLGTATKAGTYRVDITQVPTTAQVTSPNAISGTLGTNETLTFTLGSSNSVVNLTSTMTIDDIVTTINNQFTTDGLALTASKNGSDNLIITAKNKGTVGSFTVVSDVDAGGTGFGSAGMSGTGQDVAGTFTDTSTGLVYATRASSADVLIGTEGPSKDLALQFLGSTTGDFGTVQVTVGYAESLKRKLNTITNSVDGTIKGAVDRLEENIRRVDEDIRNFQERLDSREKILIEQFTRANQALQQLQSLQSSLGMQINQLNSLI